MTHQQEIDSLKAQLADLERLGDAGASDTFQYTDLSKVGTFKPTGPLAQEPKEEIDWSKVPKGTLVEVRDRDEENWLPRYYHNYDNSYDDPYRVKRLIGSPIGFSQCRLYEGSGNTVWHDWHGGECPIPEWKWCILMLRKGDYTASQTPGQCYWWHRKHGDNGYDIIKYAVIEPPVGSGDE